MNGEGGILCPDGFVLPTRNELAEGNGWIAAERGKGVLANQYAAGTSDFNYWVDGWCAFHSASRVYGEKR